MRSPKTRETPHPSHNMTKWEHSIVALSGTPRFGRIRKCKECEGEHAVTVSGEGMHEELYVPCLAKYKENKMRKITLREQYFQAREAANRSHGLWRHVNKDIADIIERGLTYRHSRKRISDRLLRHTGPPEKGEPTCLINVRAAAKAILEGTDLSLI